MKKVIKPMLIVFVVALLIIPVNFVIATITSGTNESITDTVISENTYSFSNETKDMYLPFIRIVAERVNVDKEILKPGIIFSNKSVDITKEVKAAQAIYSSDTLRISAPVDYMFVYANNVVIDSDVNKTIVVIAPDVTITENANIQEDIICISDNLTINGNVEGSVIGYTESLNLAGKINKDLRMGVNNVTFSGSDNVLGNLYLETNNESLDISSQYPNANVYFESKSETQDTNIEDMLKKAAIYGLMYSLVYFIIYRVSKNNVIQKMGEKTKQNIVFTVLSGLINICVIPFIFIGLLVISAMGLYIFGIPALLVYTALIISVIMLSTFIVGSTLYEIIKNTKILKEQKIYVKGLVLFAIYTGIYILSKTEMISGYISMLVVILAMGIVFTGIVKKLKKEKNNDSNNNNKVINTEQDVKEENKEIDK